jgi:hypothetical protein
MRQVGRRCRIRILLFGGAAIVASPLLAGIVARAQAPAVAQTATPPRVLNRPTNPQLQGFRWRSIGPTGQGGRIDDFAMNEKAPFTYFVGFAVSGLWRTVNNGTTYDPIFDSHGTSSIGDLALAPSDPNILYVGTGEANNRQSSSFGNGVWKSTNAATANAADITFVNVGLKDTQSIARIIVHPKDPNIVWVAATGHLYGPNEERGVFMTTNGGTTWTKTLYVTPDTGATELVIDPANPNNLWAAMYEHRRTAWGYVGGGPGSGIHQSVDGGKTWKKVTGNGLPRGTLGRIGLDISRSNPNVIYAQIEAAPDKETAAVQGDPDAPAGGRAAVPPVAGAGGAAAGRAGAAQAGAAAAGGAQVGGGGGGGGRGGPPAPPDPQSNGVWRSIDKGKTWTFMSNENQRPMYFSQIRVDPANPDVVYVAGVTPAKSVDGGKTFTPIRGQGHVDNHAIWISQLNSNHVMYGNDGGIDVSYDAGATWESIRMWAVALSYHASFDMRRPYWVCTGLQDNGSWCGPNTTRTGGIHQWNWISVGGGDGFQTQVDPTNPNIFYTESQNGSISRYDLSTGAAQSIRPSTGGGRGGGGGGGGGQGGGRGNVINTPPADAIVQFNWNTPIRISPHNPGTLLVGGRQLFVSRDKGQTWIMSQNVGKGIDLNSRSVLEQPYNLPACGGGGGRGGGGANRGKPCILSKHDGYVANEYGSMTELSESPILPGVLWVGTDDGNVQVSKDNGLTFTEVGKNIPGVDHEYYVSGLEASWFDAGTAYVSLDGHRNDDFKPYVFKTTDYGTTWTSVSGNLPAGNVNSIRQDPKNRNLLYAPTEFGFFVSLDDGKAWESFMPNLPQGRIDDVVVHPRENDLILATHSRGVYILDDVTSLQQMTAENAAKDTMLFQPREAVLWKADRVNVTEVPGDKWWEGDVAPRGTAIAYYLKAAATGEVRVAITNTATGQAVRTCIGTGDQGLNRFQWTLTGDPQAGGGGGGGRGGGGRGQAAAPAAAAPATPAGPTACAAPAGGGGRGGGGGGGGFGGGGGAIGVGVYRVTVSMAGREVGSQTFSIVEDVWLGER